jgi:hypothetical protein
MKLLCLLLTLFPALLFVVEVIDRLQVAGQCGVPALSATRTCWAVYYLTSIAMAIVGAGMVCL